MSSQPSEQMTRAKTSLPKDVNDALENELEYGDSKSAWIRDAVVGRLAFEGVDVPGYEAGDVEWVEFDETDITEE